MELVAYLLVIVGFIVGAGLLIRSSIQRRTSDGTQAPEPIPTALRPGETDDVLESDRLPFVQRIGVATSLLFALFMFVYWLAEPGRMEAKEALFQERAVERGQVYYGAPLEYVEGAPVQGINCARCHGADAKGGSNVFIDPNTGENRTVQVPELLGVFARYESPPPGFADATDYIRQTIERGRTDGVLGVGADMPTWSNEFGGPLTEQQVDDIIAYLLHIQQSGVAAELSGQQIFGQLCAACHGAGGSGGIGPAMVGGQEIKTFPNIEDHVAFVAAGSKQGVAYGSAGAVGSGLMPAFSGQLTAEQIRAVVEYERTL